MTSDHSAVRFVPYRAARERPHIVVDGAAQEATVLTLSHWPVNTTPPALKRDTSTEIVFAYLESSLRRDDIGWATNNHFDEDGLCGLFAVCHPERAQPHRGLLEQTATFGDFGVGDSREALRLFLTLEAFADPNRSPLGHEFFNRCEPELTAALYERLLQHFPAIIDDVNGFSDLWSADEAFIDASDAACESGAIDIETVPAIDLAIVSVPAHLPRRTFWRYTSPERSALHPFAVHRRTAANRLLFMHGGRRELIYRYESWVQLSTRRPSLRADLEPLATRLNTIEDAPGSWVADPVTDVAPRLRLDGAPESTIAADRFVTEVSSFLENAAPAWDPYDWQQ